LEEGGISRLLAGEGTVGRYGELLKLGRRGDNLTPHHVPSNAYMMAKVSGYTRNMGIVIMMEHPIPGVGGRHRQTLSYGQSPDLSLLPRQVLAIEIQDLRSLYQRERVYIETIKHGLRTIIQLNQSAWTGVFEKEDHPI
jgi:hypothetical protein